MEIRSSKKNGRRYGTLKKAVRDLISSVGGVEAAALICKKRRSVISDYQNDSKSLTSMPVELVERLENKSNVLSVTRHLASNHGFDLVPNKTGVIELAAVDHVSCITKEFGDVLAHASAFVKEGHLSPKDASALLEEIDDVRHALATMRSAVQKLIDIGEAQKERAVRRA